MSELIVFDVKLDKRSEMTDVSLQGIRTINDNQESRMSCTGSRVR